jgi:hypothetical protein
MPISKYFHGHGRKVMKEMKERYGEEAGERVFYATEAKMKKSKGSKPGKKCVGGKNPFFGNSLPFQLGDGKRWFKDSRDQGKMFTGKTKKGK